MLIKYVIAVGDCPKPGSSRPKEIASMARPIKLYNPPKVLNKKA